MTGPAFRSRGSLCPASELADHRGWTQEKELPPRQGLRGGSPLQGVSQARLSFDPARPHGGHDALLPCVGLVRLAGVERLRRAPPDGDAARSGAFSDPRHAPPACARSLPRCEAFLPLSRLSHAPCPCLPAAWQHPFVRGLADFACLQPGGGSCVWESDLDFAARPSSLVTSFSRVDCFLTAAAWRLTAASRLRCACFSACRALQEDISPATLTRSWVACFWYVFEIGIHAPPHLVAAAWEQVSVNVEGRLNFRVAHELLNRLRVRAFLDLSQGTVSHHPESPGRGELGRA